MLIDATSRDSGRFHQVHKAVREHDIEAARGLLDRLEVQYPLDEEVWMWKAGVARTPAEAVQALERALSLNQHNDRALRMLSVVRVYGSEGTFEPLKLLSVPHICRICAQRHVRTFQWCRACGCLAETSDINGMLNNAHVIRHYLEQVVTDLERRPNAEAAYAAAIGRLNLGDLAEAAGQFERALKFDPDDSRTHEWLDLLDERQVVVAVDPNGMVRYAINNVLSHHGLIIRTVASAAAGIRTLSRLRPDAVLIDLNLPDGDGLELCRRIHRAPNLANVPVIMMSGGITDRIKARMAGAEGFLQKPFDAASLLAALGVRQAEAA